MRRSCLTRQRRREIYNVFRKEPTGEPMDEMPKARLYGWLMTRGCPDDKAAAAVIEKVARDGSAVFDRAAFGDADLLNVGIFGNQGA